MLRLASKMAMARKGRLVLTSLAIILGTSFLSGTFIFSDTITKTFDRLFTDVFRDVDAYVRSSSFIEVPFGGEQRGSTPIDALPTVLEAPGVADATGDIQAFARIIGKDGEPIGLDNGPPTFGGIASASVAGLWTIEDGRLPEGPSQMVMDRASADDGGFVVGDTVRVNAQSGSREFELVGIASYGDISSPGGATFALFDQPTASEFLLKPGNVDAFLVQGDGSMSQEELAASIQSRLDPSLKLEVLTGAQIAEETKDQIGQAIGFLTTFLTIFSLIALGIGSFVIYNVFSITTAQRLRENALLRAIGAERGQVVVRGRDRRVRVGRRIGGAVVLVPHRHWLQHDNRRRPDQIRQRPKILHGAVRVLLEDRIVGPERDGLPPHHLVRRPVQRLHHFRLDFRPDPLLPRHRSLPNGATVSRSARFRQQSTSR